MSVHEMDDGTVLVIYREDGKTKHENCGVGIIAFVFALEFDIFIKQKKEADHRTVICFDDLVSH